jgi:EF-P beta-lysylation protein EpmB
MLKLRQTKHANTMTTNWQKSLKKAINGSNLNQAKNHINFSVRASQLFAPVLTDTINKQINWQDAHDPMMLQFLPQKHELKDSDGYQTDPVGDHNSSPVSGLIHKYHGRVLLIASGSCAVNCRYCFRRHYPYGQNFAPRNNWQTSIDYIKADSSIHEVILSGGDPLTLSTESLQALTSQISLIDHVKTLRIHSRIPTVMPDRIDSDFSHWASSLTLKKVMVLHINHPNELSSEAIVAVDKLTELGFTLLNQSVLLKDVNNKADVLVCLSHLLFQHNIMPYYLHQFDQVKNASHFDLSQNEINSIYQQMQKSLPGYLLPKLVKEVAGMPSKSMIQVNSK